MENARSVPIGSDVFSTHVNRALKALASTTFEFRDQSVRVVGAQDPGIAVQHTACKSLFRIEHSHFTDVGAHSLGFCAETERPVGTFVCDHIILLLWEQMIECLRNSSGGMDYA